MTGRHRQKLSQAHLAQALKISPAMVSKLKARGMPVGSITAARLWRTQNLDPSLVKEMRGWSQSVKGDILAGSELTPVMVSPPTQCHPPGDFVEQANALFIAAAQDFDRWQPVLMRAMRRVPHDQRDLVQLDFAVMDLLVGPGWARLVAADAADGIVQTSAQETFSDEDADFVGNFWYQLACGECAVS